MSYLKDISESHDAIKAIAVTMILVPFWYVSIYLFNHEFYNEADMGAVIIFCSTISTVSSFIYAIIFNYVLSDGEDNGVLHDMIASVAILSSWLSLLIFVFYSLGFLFNIYIYFYYYIIIYLAPLPILFLIGLLRPKVKKQ